MSNEELEIFSTMFKSLMALYKLLSTSTNHICQEICNKIIDLKTLLNGELSHDDSLYIEMLIKLEEINNLLSKMNYNLSFKQLKNQTCVKFKLEIENRIDSLQISSSQNHLKINNLN